MAFKDDFKTYLDSGIEKSKAALSKAGEAISKFSDESVLKIDIKQLESQVNEQFKLLGKQIFEDSQAENAGSVDLSQEKYLQIINKVLDLKKQAEEKQNSLKNLKNI